MLPLFVKKSWGWEYWFSNVNEDKLNYCGKLLYVEHDKWSSNGKYHYHKVKHETFMVLEGELQLDYISDDGRFKTSYLHPLQTFVVKIGMKHRFTSSSKTGCKFIEVSTFHSDDDSYRCYYDTEAGEWKE